MNAKRHTQDMARNWPSRIIGPAIIHYCIACPAFMITSCIKTGTRIPAPRTGQIPEDCPLQKVEMI